MSAIRRARLKSICSADIPEDEEISIYKNGDFWDLCAGPHVPRTGNCKAFKLMSVAAAFYKGDASQSTACSASTARRFKNKTMLGEYLEQLEEAKKRDHRKLGQASSTCSTSTRRSARA